MKRTALALTAVLLTLAVGAFAQPKPDFFTLSTVVVGQQAATPRPAVPIEPVSAIVEAFRSHSVVAVTAGHGEERGYAFLLSLVHDPRFVAVVNDIVIEEGSARYQDVSDRFIRGDEVSDEALSQIWQNTTRKLSMTSRH